jgi:ribosomal protein L37AE/L43A
MSVRAKVARIERRQRALASCPLCAAGTGVRSVAVCRPGEEPDARPLACPHCGAVPHQPLVIVLEHPELSNLA